MNSEVVHISYTIGVNGVYGITNRLARMQWNRKKRTPGYSRKVWQD